MVSSICEFGFQGFVIEANSEALYSIWNSKRIVKFQFEVKYLTSRRVQHMVLMSSNSLIKLSKVK